jgi:hypothetical protein
MDLSGAFGRVVALVGDAVVLLRHRDGGPQGPAVGGTPVIPPAKPQGIPTLKMPTAEGWAPGRTPVAAPGLEVNAFATGLRHPRWLHVLPDGAVLAAEALNVTGTVSSLFDYAMYSTMRRAAAVGVSPNRITLLRDTDGDGVAETRETFLEGLNQPFGMALVGDTFYVGNTDGVVAFPYAPGASRITAPGRRIARFEPGGHWTRSLLPSPDGSRLYVGVGSLSNIGEKGMEAEEGRAAIHEIDLASGRSRVLRLGPAQPGGPGLGAPDGRALDGGQRARRAGRRDAARLPDLGARGRLLRLAVLLLGRDGGRAGAAGPGPGRAGDHAGLRARRAHRRPWASAGCPRARCPASRRAWRSGSTAPGTAAG